MRLFVLFFMVLFPFLPVHPNENNEEKSIVVIIPSYNNKKWYEINLDSVLWQEYQNFRVIYIDDASTDGTGSLVSQYLEENDEEHRVTFIQNRRRLGALANIYSAVGMCRPSDIVVTVDGDDWLYHPCVFKRLNYFYSDPNVWMTYGQFIAHPDGRKGDAEKLPEYLIESNSYRDYKWVTTHLRTFYAALFHKIAREDLLYFDHFYPVTWDMAFMFPMLEMAGHHCHCCLDPLYVYNEATLLSDNKVRKEFQQHLDKQIRSKKRYQPLEKLF